MFSIIVCSINRSYLEALKTNILSTIGQPYELLTWDNLASPKSISEVYNILGDRAMFPYLCFIHEDIIFQTPGWSSNLASAFEQDPALGVIGVAGAKYKSRMPSGWSTGIRAYDCMHIFHLDKNHHTSHLYSKPNGGLLEPVVNVDGVFICIRREVWQFAHFNETFLKGFHLYDVDFSFHATAKYKAAVIFSIDIVHLTEGGNFGNEWVEDTLRWHRHNAENLPQSVPQVHFDQGAEKKIRKTWLQRLSVERISWKNKMDWVKAGGSFSDPFAWPYIVLFLFGRPFRKRT
jgi:hypothetical protein